MATTLQGVAEGAGAGREAVLGLVEAMNGAKGAAGSFTSALPQGGAVNDLGLYTGGSFDVGDLGIGSFHSGGPGTPRRRGHRALGLGSLIRS